MNGNRVKRRNRKISISEGTKFSRPENSPKHESRTLPESCMFVSVHGDSPKLISQYRTTNIHKERRPSGVLLERKTGFEPATPCLASRCSTTELHPRKFTFCKSLWCERRDLNPHRSPHWILSPARLPISPTLAGDSRGIRTRDPDPKSGALPPAELASRSTFSLQPALAERLYHHIICLSSGEKY